MGAGHEAFVVKLVGAVGFKQGQVEQPPVGFGAVLGEKRRPLPAQALGDGGVAVPEAVVGRGHCRVPAQGRQAEQGIGRRGRARRGEEQEKTNRKQSAKAVLHGFD